MKEKTKKELQKEIEEAREELRKRFHVMGGRKEDVLATIVQIGNHRPEFVIPDKKCRLLISATTEEMDMIDQLAGGILDDDPDNADIHPTPEDIKKRVKLIVLMARRLNKRTKK